MPKRPIVVVGNIAYIHLTKGYMAIVDADCVHLVSSYSWHVKITQTGVYAMSTINGQTTYMHQLILPLTGRALVDHKDRNGLNNRKLNLREATHSQNQMNRKQSAVFTSKHKGVYWSKRDKKWAVRIQIDKARHFVGLFENEDEAVSAYKEVSEKLHSGFTVVTH